MLDFVRIYANQTAANVICTTWCATTVEFTRKPRIFRSGAGPVGTTLEFEQVPGATRCRHCVIESRVRGVRGVAV